MVIAVIITKTKEGQDLAVQYEEYTITAKNAVDDPVREMESTTELIGVARRFSANSGLWTKGAHYDYHC